MFQKGPSDRSDADHLLSTRDYIVVVWMLAMVAAFYHNFLFVQSTGLSYLYSLIFFAVGLLYACFDADIRHLMLVGTVAGFVELFGDWFLVHGADSLRYPRGYPYLFASPAYMPLAWALLVVFLGYLGWRLHEEVGPAAASIGPALFALVAESGFESLASRGGGWTYEAAPLGWVGHAPLFILVAEALMFATVYKWIERDWWVGGIGMGMTVNASYVAVYYIFSLVGGYAA